MDGTPEHNIMMDEGQTKTGNWFQNNKVSQSYPITLTECVHTL